MKNSSGVGARGRRPPRRCPPSQREPWSWVRRTEAYGPGKFMPHVLIPRCAGPEKTPLPTGPICPRHLRLRAVTVEATTAPRPSHVSRPSARHPSPSSTNPT